MFIIYILYMYTSICGYIYTYMCMLMYRIYIHVYIYIYTHILFVYTCMSTHRIYIHIHICLRVDIYINYMCTCIYIASPRSSYYLLHLSRRHRLDTGSCSRSRCTGGSCARGGSNGGRRGWRQEAAMERDRRRGWRETGGSGRIPWLFWDPIPRGLVHTHAQAASPGAEVFKAL